jgi:putative chitinase
MLNKELLASTTWLGVVEEDRDPEGRGRVRARVAYVHGDIPTQDLPWVHPTLNAGGTEYINPRKGRVVNIRFLDGDLNAGYYTHAEHYNVNLQNMLETMDDDEYLYFVSMYYDHATRIYRSQQKGLVLDHEYSNIQIDASGNINSNLRDNNAKLSHGSADADQAVVLGNHFMDWLGQLMDCFMNGGFIGNMGAPTVPNPQLIQLITQFKAQKDPVFLSRHVFTVDNSKVDAQHRDYVDQVGDSYAQNTETVEAVVNDEDVYEPEDREETAEEAKTAEQYDEEAAAEEDAEEAAEEPGATPEQREQRKASALKRAVGLTEDLLRKYMPDSSASKRRLFAQPLALVMRRYNINTPIRQAHFLAQLAHETSGLQDVEEIASGAAYEGRGDLGNTQPGDGARFKGRGLIQLTGRANYAAFSKHLGKDVLSNPGLVSSDPNIAASAAGWFWTMRGLNKYADRDDVLTVSVRINGRKRNGFPNGFSDRKARLALIKGVMADQA